MSLSVGIVGLPNVGKSTLFNALLRKQQALAANYPFATIEPNTGIVEVPDVRLQALASVVAKGDPEQILKQVQDDGVVTLSQSNWPPIKPAVIEFVDIAGLVAGASTGEGLGNQFLANIRETNLICHVLRAFEDADVVLTGKMEPIEDLDTIRTELAIKDIETLEKKLQSSKAEIRNKPVIGEILQKSVDALSKSEMIHQQEWNEDEWAILSELHLLTAKPELFVINVTDTQIADSANIQAEYAQKLKVSKDDVVVVSAKIEAELSELSSEEQLEFLNDLGLQESGLQRMAGAAYIKLGLMSFLTAGEKEVRAWTIDTHTRAPQAAGVIHTDFEKKFIKADVINWNDFVSLGGWKNGREAGKVRLEGKDYIMQEGDVVDFKIGS